MRLEKRTAPRAGSCWRAVGAVAFTLLISGLLVLWAGAPVGRTYALLLQGAFGSVFALTETLTRAMPLILTGLAAAVAFRARLFNIGAEGQLYAGALAAVAVGGMHGGTGLRAVALRALPAHDGCGRAGRRTAAAGPGADEGTAGCRRGGDHAAAQLHRAALRIGAARRRR